MKSTIVIITFLLGQTNVFAYSVRGSSSADGPWCRVGCSKLDLDSKGDLTRGGYDGPCGGMPKDGGCPKGYGAPVVKKTEPAPIQEASKEQNKMSSPLTNPGAKPCQDGKKPPCDINGKSLAR